MAERDAAASRTWFVTGTSAGLGKALAEAIIDGGVDRLVATARDPEQIRYLESRGPGRVKVMALDVTNPESVTAGVQAGIEAFGGVDILVNNAGVGCVGAIEECQDEDLMRVFGTNVFGTLRVTRAMLPHFRAKRTGRIIVMSSASGVLPTFGHGGYSASKCALEGAIEVLAQEVAPLGIIVSMVEPGLFKSDFRARNIGRAKGAISDYDGITGQTRAGADAPYAEDTPEPQDFVAPVLGIAAMEHPPLRLPIGLGSWGRIRQRVADRHKETEELWEVAQNDARIRSTK